jgi:hypothetical protein
VKGPQITLIWYTWDDESFSFSTTKDRAKYRLFQHDPAISLLVEDGPPISRPMARLKYLRTRKILEKYVPRGQGRGISTDDAGTRANYRQVAPGSIRHQQSSAYAEGVVHYIARIEENRFSGFQKMYKEDVASRYIPSRIPYTQTKR